MSASLPRRGGRCRACQASTISIRCMAVGWVPNSTIAHPAAPGRLRLVSASSLVKLRGAARDRGWSRARPSRPPPRSGGERVLGRASTAICSATATSSASGTARGSYIPPRRRVASAISHADGQRDQREPAAQLPQVVARVVRELVRDHDPHLAVAERRLEQRVPQDHAPRRPEADRERVRLVGELVHVLDPHRDVGDALLACELRRLRGEPVVLAAASGRGTGTARRT